MAYLAKSRKFRTLQYAYIHYLFIPAFTSDVPARNLGVTFDPHLFSLITSLTRLFQTSFLFVFWSLYQSL